VIDTVCSPDGTVLAYFVSVRAMPDQTRFLTPVECNLQVGQVVYPSGGEIARHIHLPLERHIVGTTEVLLVQQGRCKVDVFTADRQLVTTRELSVGDMVIAVSGGHGFRVLEDLVLLEIKQGPYPGGAEKERF
jgi:mannose-6-phosphate isomerase-like protein (cupin superfamily)